jgi:hypothetical protein
VKSKVREVMNPPKQKIHTEIYSSIAKPKAMANVEELALAKKKAMYAAVALPEHLPLTSNASYEAAKGPSILCRSMPIARLAWWR